MSERKHDTIHVRCTDTMLERLDARVAEEQSRRPLRTVKRADLVREYIERGLTDDTVRGETHGSVPTVERGS